VSFGRYPPGKATRGPPCSMVMNQVMPKTSPNRAAVTSNPTKATLPLTVMPANSLILWLCLLQHPAPQYRCHHHHQLLLPPRADLRALFYSSICHMLAQCFCMTPSTTYGSLSCSEIQTCMCTLTPAYCTSDGCQGSKRTSIFDGVFHGYGLSLSQHGVLGTKSHLGISGCHAGGQRSHDGSGNVTGINGAKFGEDLSSVFEEPLSSREMRL